MSYCTFLIIKGKKRVLRSEHYNEGHKLVQLKYKNPLNFGSSDLKWSDTKNKPALIVNFNKKRVISTWFDDYDKDIQKGWKYIKKERK